MKGIITDIQRFCTHDGPGIRTTIFLKGCSLRCRWCHNPETQQIQPQILYNPTRCSGCGKCAEVCSSGAHVCCNGIHTFDGRKCNSCTRCAAACAPAAIELIGRSMTVEELLTEVKKDTVFYTKTGGMTLSGGEPMFQPDFTIALLTAARQEGINTCMETCGYAKNDYFRQAAELCNLFIWDIKDTDRVRHKDYTGVDPTLIYNNLHMVDEMGASTLLRCIMVQGVNMDATHAAGIAQIYSSLKYCNGVELLKYHPMGGSKMTQLGFKDNGRKDWIPSENDMASFAKSLASQGIKLINAFDKTIV